MREFSEQDVFALVGEAGFERLCRAFYAGVVQDDILGPMYPADDMAGAEQRLKEFLVYRFGGPPRYIEQRGHPRLRMRHAPFKIDAAARDRWMELMKQALKSSDLNPVAEQVLLEFFEHMTTFLINQRP